VPAGGRVVDLGCGVGLTLAVLAARLDGAARLVGVDAKAWRLDERLAGDPRVESVVADLEEPLPFATATFDAGICHNVLEDLRAPDVFLVEAARVLAPGGHLLLGHSDFDTLVFSSSDLELTRRIVHRFSDTVQPWMTTANGTIGRELLAVGRRSPLEVVRTFAWVGHHTSFQEGGPAHTAATLVANDARRDAALAPHVDGWLEDLRAQAGRGEFFYSLNDYAVLLRKPA
jgi:SAM-dependent methyltransferase